MDPVALAPQVALFVTGLGIFGLAAVILDDWRWHRALNAGQRDNQSAAERAVRESEAIRHHDEGAIL